MLPRGVRVACLVFFRLELIFFQTLGEIGEASSRFWQVVLNGEKSCSLSISEWGVSDLADIRSSLYLFGVSTIEERRFSRPRPWKGLVGSVSGTFIKKDQTNMGVELAELRPEGAKYGFEGSCLGVECMALENGSVY